MDASIATAIIGLLGAAAVGGLGFILQGMRADIQTNGERMGGLGERIGGLGERIGGLGERISGLSERSARFEEFTLAQFGEIKQVLARIEATQADHGRQFEKLAGDLP